MRSTARVLLVFAAASILVLAGLRAARRVDTTLPEARRLAAAMNWREGMTIAEIGAGRGVMAIWAARRAGAGTRCYANELDAARVSRIQASARREGVTNLVVVQGAPTATNLPADCCDAMFMRRVYHHFAEPAAMNASLFRNLRPNGLLAVLDFDPDLVDRVKCSLAGSRKPDGIARGRVIREIEQAGFLFEQDVQPWPARGYCLLFRKPPPLAANPQAPR